ncbi:hypothetical protein [Campylobacter sp.]|uniref:hypothetical protein n=1 Tax=Campylobacter sp. TaxID=205 RepID=UPI002AA63D36|nr:hypothetical protein [Campylobacter sp.]
MSSHSLPCVIPRLDPRISSNRRHCEGAKRPKQSHQIAVIASEAISRNSRFYLKFPTMSSPNLKPCVIPRLDRGISSNRRHCEGSNL